MEQPYFIAIMKTKALKKEDASNSHAHCWEYNLQYSGENTLFLTTGTFVEQIINLIEHIFTEKPELRQKPVVIFNNQISTVFHLVQNVYPNVTSFETYQKYPKHLLGSIFKPDFLTKNNLVRLHSSVANDDKTLYVATDGAGGVDTMNRYYGWFYIENGKPFYTVKKSSVSATNLVETEAILRAILDTIHKPAYDKIVIQSDSQTGLKAIGAALEHNNIPNNLNYPLIIDLLQQVKSAMIHKSVVLEFVPGHSGYHNNESIDTLIEYYRLSEKSVENKLMTSNVRDAQMYALAILLSGAFSSNLSSTKNNEKIFFEPKVLVKAEKNRFITTFLTKN